MPKQVSWKKEKKKAGEKVPFKWNRSCQRPFHPLQKWPPIEIFFFYIKKSLANHVLMIKIQKNVFFKRRLLRVILM